MHPSLFISGTLGLAALILSLNAGAANYEPPLSFKLDGQNPNSGVIADFNGDGIDDFAAVFPIFGPGGTDFSPPPVIGSRINFLVGDISSNLKIETTFNLPFKARSMATGDFNGDGNPDLAVAQDLPEGGSLECGSTEGTVIYFGSHNEIQPDLSYAGCVTSIATGRLATIDANGDAYDDLIIDDQLLLGNGDGSFTLAASLPSGDKNVADINGDGVMDIMADTEAVCGNGDGSFSPCDPVANDPLVDTNAAGEIVTIPSWGALSESGVNPAILGRSKLQSGDFDGDGIADLMGWAVTSTTVPVKTYWKGPCGWTYTLVRTFTKRGRSGRGSGSFRTRRLYIYRCSYSNSPISGWEQIDITLENRVIPATSALRISLVRADGSIEQLLGPEVDGYIRAIKVDDVNGDGHLDVLASIGRSDIDGNILNHPDFPNWALFAGNGDGSFAPPVDSGLSLGYWLPGDFNGDGLTDFGRYLTPFDSEHSLSITFHTPPSSPTAQAPDTTPPNVAILSPTDGTEVSGTLQIAASASDDTGIAKVVFNLGATELGQATSAPYQISWDTSALSPGTYTLEAVAFDLAGNSQAATISVTVPSTTTTTTSPPTDPTPADAQPTGNTVEFSGTVTEVGSDYFVVDGLKVTIGSASIMKYEDGFGPAPKVGDPVQGKADEYSDGSHVAVKAQFG